MYLQSKVVLVLVDEEVLEVVFDFVDVEDGRADLAFTVTDGTFFLHLHFCLGTHALACDLDETKLGGRQDFVLGAVVRHGFDQGVVEFLAMFGFVQVDKVHNDDAAHVAQAQLARNLLGSIEVDLEGVFFRRVVLVEPMAAVHVDDVHGLGVLDDKVNAVFDGDNLTEKAFDLLGNVIIVKDGVFAFVKLHNLSLLRCNGTDVTLDFFIESFVVHMDVVERLVQQIAQHDAGLAHFADHPAVSGHLFHLDDALFPLGDECPEVGVEFGHLLAFGDGADDDAIVVGLDALDETAKAVALFTTADFLRYRNAVREGNEDEITSCKRDLCRDSWAFGVDRLLGNLHRNQVTDIEHIGDFAVFRQVGIKFELVHGEILSCHDPLLVLEHGMGLQAQVEIVQEGLLGIADVDECRVEARQQFLHPA